MFQFFKVFFLISTVLLHNNQHWNTMDDNTPQEQPSQLGGDSGTSLVPPEATEQDNTIIPAASTAANTQESLSSPPSEGTSDSFEANSSSQEQELLDYGAATDLLQSTFAAESNQWTTKELFIDVATSLQDDTPVSINILDTLVQDRVQRKLTSTGSVVSTNSVYWLHSKFNQNNEQYRGNVLSCMFVLAGQVAGFNLVSKGWEPKGNLVRMVCQRWRKCHTNNNRLPARRGTIRLPPQQPPSPSQRTANFKKGWRKKEMVARRVKTNKPVDSSLTDVVLCPFRFCVCWDPERCRWYLPKKQTGVSHHCGHPKRLPEQIRIRTNKLGEDQIKRITNCLNVFVQSSSISDLTYLETGVDIEQSQIQYHRKKIKQQFYLSAVPGNVAHADSTAADRLLANLEADPHSSYIVLYGSYESNLLTIYRKVKTTTAPTTLSAVDQQDLVDEVDSAEAQAEKLKSSLAITGTGLVLLAVAWTNDAARRRFEMFPEFCGFDCTASTNAEQRPLMQAVSVDSDNRSVPHTWAFLPSQSRWVFHWFFGTAMVALHTISTLN
jgi:hypothetical protein